ncbi:MAG: hypothetical protein JW894_08290 [Bacteroidales bacterium]|nr:hypothetical protein [Bacteroidales bacterium]
MKKYSFLVYHKEYIEFLEELQKLGVVHVIEKETGEIEDEEIKAKYKKLNELNQAIQFLSKRESNTEFAPKKADFTEILEELKRLWSDQETNQHKLSALQKEKSQIEPWGDFSWHNIHQLNNSGLNISFCICPARKYNAGWENQYSIAKINEITGFIYFVVFHKEDEKIDVDAEFIRLPRNQLSFIDKQIDELKLILGKTEEIFDDYATKFLGSLKESKEQLLSELHFNKIVLSTEKEAEDKLMILEGWVPDDCKNNVADYLNSASMHYEISEPTKEDSIPIKLKNNWFARLFEVIGDLYSRPSYKELDLTPLFAPFYWLFFGFCLGDAGYGLLISVVGLILLFGAKKESKNLFKLVSLLGLSTIIFGLIGGTFFGISLYEIKFGFYADLANKFDAQNKTINDHLFTLALIFGAVQIIFGMFIKIFNEIKMFNWKYAIGTIGWLIIILGAAGLYFMANAGVSATLIRILKWSVIILGGSGAFLFNNPERNILANIGGGIWDAYNVVTGMLGDILSYIRLFALGISSAILGYVFNSLAVEFAPDNIIGKILIMAFILIFGHGINLFMAALGSFVHPVRLTFVEFYKNAGFIGGGIKYSPFRKNK